MNRTAAVLTPTKARFRPDEEIRFHVDLPPVKEPTSDRRPLLDGGEVTLQVVIRQFGRKTAETSLALDDAIPVFSVANPATELDGPWPSAYSIEVRAESGGNVVHARTSIDVAPDGMGYPRFGFLSNFGPDDVGSDVVKRATAYHLTHLQYYDWMYRHEDLVSVDDEYRDPMGRPTSLPAIRLRIAECHDHGIVASAYGAIYGAGREFADQHPEWALYRRDGERHSFIDWLTIMNVSEGCGWRDHLVEQYLRAATDLGFDGFHMDTYGYPKRGYDSDGRLVHLERVFPGLISAAREALEALGSRPVFLTFNAVNDWPTGALANARTDALYTEVWAPHIRYRDLWRLVREARMRSSKPVILAAYLSPFLPDRMTDRHAEAGAVGALLYATAVITSAGANHLVLGEADGVLCDPYYVNHGTLPLWARPIVRRYYDFLTAYGPLFLSDQSQDLSLDFAHGPDDEFMFDGVSCSAAPEAGSVWTVVRETPSHYVVGMVNLAGLDSDEWNQPHPMTVGESGPITITMLSAESLGSCTTDSPDPPPGATWADEPTGSEELHLEEVMVARGPAYRVRVPPVRLWRLLVVDKRPIGDESEPNPVSAQTTAVN